MFHLIFRKMNCASLISCSGILVCVYALYVEHSKEADSDYQPACDISDRISCTKAFLSKFVFFHVLINNFIDTPGALDYFQGC